MRTLFPNCFLPSCRLTSIETDLSCRDLLSGLHAGATAATLKGPRPQGVRGCRCSCQNHRAANASRPAHMCSIALRPPGWAGINPRPTATLAGGHPAVCYHRDSVIGTWVSCCGTNGPANSNPTSLVHGRCCTTVQEYLVCPDRGVTAGKNEGKLAHRAKEAHERPSRRMLPYSTEGSGTWCL